MLLDLYTPIVIDTPKEFSYIEVLVASDMHYGSEQFNERKWSEFENLISVPNVYVAFVGDHMENATRTGKSDVYTQTVRPAEQKRWWIEHMRNYADKVLCIVDGNHDSRQSKDGDYFPLYDIALMLGIEDRYRPDAAILDIGVGQRKPSDERQWRYFGYVVHKAQNQVNYGTADGIDGIDFFLSGHTHKPQDRPLGKLVYDPYNKQVRERSVENIVGGHFLNYGGYAARAGYRATSQKLYKLILHGTKKEISTSGFYV